MKTSIMYYVLCIMVMLFLCVTYTYATDSTPSADIKIQLEELKTAIASKAAILKQEINRKLKDKAYVGQVKSKENSSLALSTDSGPKTASFNQDTVFESSIKGKKFSAKLLSEDDYIVVLGDTDEIRVLIAKKVILLPKPTKQQKTLQSGRVESILDSIVTLKNKDSKIIKAAFPAETKIKINSFVALTGILDKNNIFQAEFVYVIPSNR